jgi:hypothetical protein
MLLIVLINGCSSQATRIAREAANRQAQQNTAMADLNKEVASGTHRLVEADAQARKEIVGVHHELQSERMRLDTSWNSLEDERRQIAGQRTTQSMFVALAPLIGGTMLLVVLLGFCWYALAAARDDDGTVVELNEMLVHEILRDEPTLLTDGGQSPSLLGNSRPNN